MLPENNIIITPKNKKKKVSKKTYILSFIISLLFFSLIGASAYLFYYVGTKIDQNLLPSTNSTVDQNKFASLDDRRCKTETEYSNELIPSATLNAYDRSAFYSENPTVLKAKAQVSNQNTLYVELLSWEDEKADALTYSGRALICIKDLNKEATIFFTTDNTTFKNPVRYKDPETSIRKVLIQAIYVVPNGAEAKSDWKTKIENNLKNIQSAQQRIFDGKSSVDYRIYPEAVAAPDLSRDLLSRVATGIVNKDTSKDSDSMKPSNFVEENIYSQAAMVKHPEFYVSDAEKNTYNMVSTVIYFEVGASSKNSKRYESGYAYISPLLDNGNYFAIIGVNLANDISLDSSPYHEFMHTLGLPDEYAYADGTTQRVPTHLFKGVKQSDATLMEDPDQLNLKNTYVDDQERVMMGIKD